MKDNFFVNTLTTSIQVFYPLNFQPKEVLKNLDQMGSFVWYQFVPISKS